MNRLIKDNQKHFNRLQVALDGLVTIVAYLISWYAMLRSVEGKAIGVLPPEFYMMVLVILVPFFFAAQLCVRTVYAKACAGTQA